MNFCIVQKHTAKGHTSAYKSLLAFIVFLIFFTSPLLSNHENPSFQNLKICVQTSGSEIKQKINIIYKNSSKIKETILISL